MWHWGTVCGPGATPSGLVTHLNYESLVTSYGLEFWPLETEIAEIIQSEKMRAVLESGSLLGSLALMSKIAAGAAIQLTQRSLEASAGMELVIAGFAGLWVALAIAEKKPACPSYRPTACPSRLPDPSLGRCCRPSRCGCPGR